MAADRYGLSFYSCHSICSQLGFTDDQYLKARDGLIAKDLIAFDGTIFQVLSLPQPLNIYRCGRKEGPVSVGQIFQRSFKGFNP